MYMEDLVLNCCFALDKQGLTADLIQLKENARIAEIRVIPLGATVDLSTGAYQLG